MFTVLQNVDKAKLDLAVVSVFSHGEMFVNITICNIHRHFTMREYLHNGKILFCLINPLICNLQI